MYREKIVGNQDSFNTYSIYSSLSTYTLRYQNHRFHHQCTRRFCKPVSALDKLFFFVVVCLSRLSKYDLIANIVSFSFTTWNSFYSFTETVMYQNTEERRPHQLQELLRTNLDVDSRSSEDFTSLIQIEDKSKKSIFSSLLKRKRKGPKMKITKKVEAYSTIDFGAESLSSDQEIAQYASAPVDNYSEPCKQKGFLKKIIKRSSKSPYRIQRCPDPQNCEKNTPGDLNTSILVPTTYTCKNNIKIISGINELQDILHNLHHSEQHVVYLLKKYVEDKNVQKQLFEASFEYFALQYDSKTQVNILANKMWFQQIQVAKMEDYNMQKRLNRLVKTNRALESQIECLHRHCEKLASKTNVYPKRFLHMRSFGKVYARQLIESNRKLQKKVGALTIIVGEFEEEVEKLQHQKTALEEEKRSSKSQIYHLEGLLEKKGQDFDLERSTLRSEINHHQNAIRETAATIQVIFQEFQDFDFQLREFSIRVAWPTISNTGLPEMAHQLRGSIKELFVTIINSCRSIFVAAQEIPKLRNTNARLQENLQKSTHELDNLGKKLGKYSETEITALEAKCRQSEQENVDLRFKLDSMTADNNTLSKDIEAKRKSLSELKTSVNDMLAENELLYAQIDEVLAVAIPNEDIEVPKEFHSNREKLEYLKLRYGHIVSDQKQLVGKCNSLEDDNQYLIQTQQAYLQDIATLQDGVTMLSAENENIKKHLNTEHQTVITLQNERLKYLEEKNILKTIFNHLKSEVGRIQQLEGAVSEMTREASRLTLVADLNKQLGEQLKNEVEIKDSTIMELRQSLEKLSHMQLDNDKEKMTLSAQLSEIVTVKEKLSSCLELELRKNMKLDESKKKLESNTSSQLKLYEEMQKNERAALKELLKDFKNLIKQRDCLVMIQAENKKKYKDLDKRYGDLKAQFDGVVAQGNQKEEEILRLVERLQATQEQHHQQEQNSSSQASKYEKTIRKMERLLGQLRNEKGETETSNEYLKNNLQKLQNELDAAREKSSLEAVKMAAKVAECATLETELNNYKNDLKLLREDYGKLSMESDYLKKLHDQQISDFKEAISNASNKDAVILDLQTTILGKDHQINELNKAVVDKDSEIKRQEHECLYLNKKIDDQNKIMIGYENHLVSLQEMEPVKKKLEKLLNNAEIDMKTAAIELENCKKENETLKNEMKALICRTEKERSFYKKQTDEIISEYSAQKTNVEEEIDNISNQLRVVTENLQAEKRRFEELSKDHDQLQLKYVQLKDNLKSEILSHKETQQKVVDMDSFIQAVANERNHLQQQAHMLLVEINEGREHNQKIVNENKRLSMILEEGKQHYLTLERNNSALEQELKRVNSELSKTGSSQGQINKTVAELSEKNKELESAMDTIDSLRKELTESQKTVFGLKEDFFKLQQQVTGLEFKNCELTLQLHESQGKLETERSLYKDLKSPGRTTPTTPTGTGELYF